MLILASASPRRRELLQFLGMDFQVLPSAYDEVVPARHGDPEALACQLAREKARDVARHHSGALVLGADTLVVLGDRVFGKPADREDAERMLLALSGRTHRVVTGVALVERDTERTFAVSTEVRFRRLHPVEVKAYVATGEPADKAGAYAIQGHGAFLIEEIRGDYTNVVGLPLTRLAMELRQLGRTVFGLGALEATP